MSQPVCLHLQEQTCMSLNSSSGHPLQLVFAELTWQFVLGADVCHEVLKLQVLHCSEGPTTGNKGDPQQSVEHEQLSWPNLRLVQKRVDPFLRTHNSSL